MHDLAQALAEGSVLPKLLVIVTGKGPLRAAYQRKMQQLDLRCVAFRTLWLESEDYPRLLGACDMGVSLHISSSGFDLPMKVRQLRVCIRLDDILSNGTSLTLPGCNHSLCSKCAAMALPCLISSAHGAGSGYVWQRAPSVCCRLPVH